MLKKTMDKLQRAYATIEIAKHMGHEIKVFRKRPLGGYETEFVPAKYGYDYITDGWHIQLGLDRDWNSQIPCWSKIINDFKFAAMVEDSGKLKSQYHAALENYEAGVFMNDPEYSFEVMAQALKDLVLFTDK